MSNLVAQVKQDQAFNLIELIKMRLKSSYGVPLSRAMLDRRALALAQEQLEHERTEMQKKLDTIIYPILNYDALPSLGIKMDAPRWTTAVEQFVAEPWLTRSATRFNVSFQFANTALRTDASVIPGVTVCPLCKRDVSPTVWHLMTECTLKTCELNMPHLPPRVPLTTTAQDPTSTDDEATAPSAKVARGSNAYLAQEILWTLREFRPAGEAWPTDLLVPNEKNTFLKEFNRACTTLELSCQSRQRDDDRGLPPVLDNDGEIAKFDTLRFLACHLPRDPLASVFKVPKDEEGKVNKDQAEEMHEKKKTFFEVWERLHQLIVEAINQAKAKYNRMSAASRAASREDDQAPQFRETNAYQINETTPARAERAQAQRSHRDERNEKRSAADLLELNKKNEMQKKGNHINAVVATSQIGHVLQARIDEHVTLSQPFVLPANLTFVERTSRWTRMAEPTGAGEEEEHEDAMEVDSTRNSSRLSYDADDDSSRRQSEGSSLVSSRAVTPPPNSWGAAADDDEGGYSGIHDGDGNEGDEDRANVIPGGDGSKGGDNELQGSDGGKGGSSRRGSGKGTGDGSGIYGGKHGDRSGGRGLSDRGGGKSGKSNELRNDGGGKGSSGRQHGRGKGKGGNRELCDGDGSKGDSSGLHDGGSSSAGSRSSHHNARHGSKKMNKKQKRAEQRRESSSDSSAAQRPAGGARAAQLEKKQKQH